MHKPCPGFGFARVFPCVPTNVSLKIRVVHLGQPCLTVFCLDGDFPNHVQPCHKLLKQNSGRTASCRTIGDPHRTQPCRFFVFWCQIVFFWIFGRWFRIGPCSMIRVLDFRVVRIFGIPDPVQSTAPWSCVHRGPRPKHCLPTLCPLVEYQGDTRA